MNLKVFISPPSGYGIENMTAILLLIIKILQFHWSFVLILYILNKSVNSSIIELLYFFQKTRQRHDSCTLTYSMYGQTDDFFYFLQKSLFTGTIAIPAAYSPSGSDGPMTLLVSSANSHTSVTAFLK